MEQKPKLNIDIKTTTPITSPEGNQVFQEGFVLRKVSKFLAGTNEDAIIPIPVFFDVVTGKILIEMLPKELRDEYSEKKIDVPISQSLKIVKD